MLLPAVPEALKCYCTEFMSAFDKFIEEADDSDENETALNTDV